jgi:hypothetical protein
MNTKGRLKQTNFPSIQILGFGAGEYSCAGKLKQNKKFVALIVDP